MPFGGFLNAIPPAVVILLPGVAVGSGACGANKSFAAGARSLAWGFTLYALAEIVYMTYHLDWTVFLFAHTIAEVLDLLAFILAFSAVAKAGLAKLGKAS